LILRDYWAKTSFAEGYGGIITFISKQSCPFEESITETVLCAGRAHRICNEGDDNQLVICNVHNYELHKSVMDNLCSSLDRDFAVSKANPLKFCVFACGYFNCAPNDMQLFEYSRPESKRNSEDSEDEVNAAPRPAKGKLMRTLDKATEIAARAPTRYNSTSDAGIILDRVWTTIPANYLTLHKVTHLIEQDPKDLFKSGISDHAPCCISILWRTPFARGEGPIAPEVTRHPLYSAYFLALCWEENYKDLIFLSEFDSLLFLKNIMKAAAGYVRDYLQNHMDHLPIIRSQQITSIARAVWMQSIPQAETLLKHSKFARTHLRISEDKVFLADNIVFQQIADQTNTDLLRERADLICAGPRPSEKKLKVISNLAQLWIPLGKSLILAGIKVEDKILRNEPDLTIAMGQAWQPTFSPKEFSESDAKEFIDTVEGLGEYRDTPPPDQWAFSDTIWRARDSSPGGDGLPYSAWRATGLTGVKALMNCDDALRRGVLPPPEFNESGTVFSPKGSQPHDPVEVIREPLQTRPLSMKNTDNKIIVASNVHMLEPQYQKITHKSQNGFTKGRNFLNNCLDLDAAARIFSMIFESVCGCPMNPSNLPLLCAFDFEAAFPSVIHCWIWLVLKVRKLPDHYIKLFMGIYQNASATFMYDEAKHVIINFLSGVLQGCPGSAFLFNNALDPFLCKIHCILREKNMGIVRACADDIGICLGRLKHLQLIAPIFSSALKLAGLKLKPPKCVIVPLCMLDDKRKKDISKWLKRNIPDWQDFAVKSSTKLLGFYLGPEAGKMNWTEQEAKIRTRVHSIKTSQAPSSLNAHTYNSRVVPVTSFVAQLLPIPARFYQLERAMLHTVLRLPQNMLCHCDFMHLHKIGGPKFRSITAASSSALVRTSLKTVTSWKSWIEQLEHAADVHLPLQTLVRNTLTPANWDSPPLAVNLRDASLGFPSHPHFDFSKSDLLCRIKGSDLSKVPVQKLVYDELISIKHAFLIHDTIERRLNKLFQPFTLDFINSISLTASLKLLKGSRVADVMKVLKSWCNGWATSTRYHEEIRLPCLFGCNNYSDSLEHYLQCSHIYALWKFMVPEVHEDPLVRWGLINSSNDAFKQIACTHAGYHAVRRHHKESGSYFCQNMTHINGALLRTSWTVFADTFTVEARELGVSSLKFSVSSFLCFLTTGERPSSLSDGPFDMGELPPSPTKQTST